MQTNSDSDKLMIILCHVSIFLGVALLLPLVMFLWKKDQSPTVAAHAKEALNFHISVFIYSSISGLLCLILIGILLLPIVLIGAAILAIVATIKASNGELYRYPLTLRLVS